MVRPKMNINLKKSHDLLSFVEHRHNGRYNAIHAKKMVHKLRWMNGLFPINQLVYNYQF